MDREPRSQHYAAVALISLALLALEIVVARVLSVALMSHFAFVAISVTMFGIGLSALVVYLLPGRFPPERLDGQIALFSCLFGLTAVASMAVFLRIPVENELSLRGMATLSLMYGVLVVPFFCGGLCISLFMTHFSSQIGRVYFADLAGASVGCAAVVVAMNVWPAPRVSLAVGLLAALVGLMAALTNSAPAGRRRSPFLLAVAVSSVAVIAGFSLVGGADALRIRYVKDWPGFYADSEAWNAFSRVSAFHSGYNAAGYVPLGRPAEDYGKDVPEAMVLDIDGTAWTPMIDFDRGDLESLGFLRDSILYVAHHLRSDASVLVIGTGGGRDILAAKLFEQPSVVGIELNPLMEEMVQERYGEFSGRPYTLPGVEVVFDEARSRLTTLEQRFDVIQLSLIDTFSLNAAGGFVFSENYLYTTEAFREYYRHLTERGLVSVSRYYNHNFPIEIVKTAAMMRQAWAAEGVENPARHIVILGQLAAATVLGKRTPFTESELEQLDEIAEQARMQVLYRPDGTGEIDELRAVLETDDLDAYVDAHPFQIRPATDDRPFFFNFLRGRLAAADLPTRETDPMGFLRLWNEAVLLLYMLLGIVSVLAVVFFLGPLLLLAGRPTSRASAKAVIPLLLYFCCLGYGFMTIEIPLLQRFILLLGYPVYALSVVLFSLLLFSALGSLASSRWVGTGRTALLAALAGIVALAFAYAAFLPPTIESLLGSTLAVRIAATVALLAPIGLLLGTAYPLGIGVLRAYDDALVPWAWGLNGALSVVASVFAIFLGSRIGFGATFFTGIAAYALGLVLVAALPSPRTD